MGYFYANVTSSKARPRQVQGHAGEWSRARLFRWEKQILWEGICLSAHTEDRFVSFVVIAHLQHHLSETPDASVTATRAYMSRNQCASCPCVLPGATHRAKDARVYASVCMCVRACVGGRNSELHCLPPVRAASHIHIRLRAMAPSAPPARLAHPDALTG